MPGWSGGVHLIGMYKNDLVLTGDRLVRGLRDLELPTRGGTLPSNCCKITRMLFKRVKNPIGIKIQDNPTCPLFVLSLSQRPPDS